MKVIELVFFLKSLAFIQLHHSNHLFQLHYLHTSHPQPDPVTVTSGEICCHGFDPLVLFIILVVSQHSPLLKAIQNTTILNDI
jgi:hypothetical protein